MLKGAARQASSALTYLLLKRIEDLSKKCEKKKKKKALASGVPEREGRTPPACPSGRREVFAQEQLALLEGAPPCWLLVVQRVAVGLVERPSPLVGVLHVQVHS